MKPGVDHLKIFIIGSGAEFDRRYPIQECSEEIIKYSWPIDPYGLSKNIITRRVLESLNNIWILRLFGCFNWDDDPERFIKNGILNLKNGKPIIIHQNKKMDYFYLDDIFIVIDYIIKTYTNKIIPKNINLVYNKKVTLLDIASLIHKYVGKFKPKIQLNETEEANSYTGSSTILYRLPISSKLIGLEEGIQQTVKKLYE
jgi:GDP-L-fucose synthase